MPVTLSSSAAEVGHQRRYLPKAAISSLAGSDWASYNDRAVAEKRGRSGAAGALRGSLAPPRADECDTEHESDVSHVAKRSRW